MAPLLRHRTLAAGAALAGALSAGMVLLTPSVASAHSLDSSTLSVRVDEDSVDVTVSVPLETLDRALGTDHTAATDVDSSAAEVVAYLGEHLTVTGADGTTCAETRCSRRCTWSPGPAGTRRCASAARPWPSPRPPGRRRRGGRRRGSCGASSWAHLGMSGRVGRAPRWRARLGWRWAPAVSTL